jgi:hypothetical protein
MRSASTLIAFVAAATVALGGCGQTRATPSPSPTPVPSPNADEVFLLAGVRADAAIGCVPIRQVLPAGGIATIECIPNNEAVDRFRVTLFSNVNDALALYLAEMTAHGVALNSGTCFDGRGESTYMPGPDDASVPNRNGCFVTDVSNYRAILPGDRVYIAIAGKSAYVSKELDTFAWVGNEDVPGSPTLWRMPPR